MPQGFVWNNEQIHEFPVALALGRLLISFTSGAVLSFNLKQNLTSDELALVIAR